MHSRGGRIVLIDDDHELLRLVRGDLRQALKAGSGWAIGWVLSTVFQLVTALIMVALFVWQVSRGV